ncbi:MAG: carboxy terminal-processing peptidase [Gammaproteobacteria bacterium]
MSLLAGRHHQDVPPHSCRAGRAVLAILGAATLYLFLGAAAATPSPTVERSALVPSEAHARATELVLHFIANYHYRKVALDDALSAQILERYLETLDPNRNYFTSADVAEFRKRDTQFDDLLEAGRLQPAFEIFLTLRDRVDARSQFARAVLAKPLDFGVKEEFDFDRAKAPWASEAELDDFWRKRVKNDYLSLKLAGKADAEIRETLQKRYEDLARRTDQLNADDVFELFINAYLASVEPHTSYFSPRTSENFRIRMSLSLEGIGAILQSDNEYTLVRQILKGGPADKSGVLHEDDRIIAVGQGLNEPFVDVIGWRIDDVVDLIRGKKDSIVRLQVLPKGMPASAKPKVVTLTRSRIELEDEAAKQSVIEIPKGEKAVKVGVINLPTFYQDFEARARGDEDYRSTTRDVRRLIGELENQGVEGIIIDLRGNGGGSLTEATELTGLFITTGPVVQVRNSDGTVHVERDTDPEVAYAGPLAVLVDRNSASASEIFAGAIQDYRRGIIIGEPTFGKGTVQNLIDLGEYDNDDDAQLGQLKATIAQFFRVAGDSTQHRGVVPDITFPTALGADDEGERALPNALPWARIEAANYSPAQAPVSEFTRARSLHQQRLENDRAFQVLLEEERAVREAREKTKLSLLEIVRKEEQERAEREQKAREERFRAATGQAPPKSEDAEDELGEKKPDNATDLVLQESARILDDLVVPGTFAQQASTAAAPASPAD